MAWPGLALHGEALRGGTLRGLTKDDILQFGHYFLTLSHIYMCTVVVVFFLPTLKLWAFFLSITYIICVVSLNSKTMHLY